MKKRLLSLLLSGIMVFSLTACSGGISEKDVKDLVQGNLDMIYLAKFDKDYLKSVDITEEEAREEYEAGLEVESNYFMQEFAVEYMNDDLQADIMEMYDEVYSHSKYTVGDPVKVDDSTYRVEVTIESIDILSQVTDASEDAINAFYEKYPQEVVSEMTEEEYMAYDEEWARIFLDLCWEYMDQIGYLEPEVIEMEVEKDDDNLWMITDESMMDVDTLIIYYP